MIEINNLTKVYSSNQFKAVDDINLTIESGEIYGFLGPNGAGKSTTIKCITGILDYSQGSIKINGIDLQREPILAKKKIGFVPDEHVIYEGLTGLQYINFICNIFEVAQSDRQERIDKYVALFGMTDKINDQISSYSHGMKQKISIISALVHDPEVFILDEPLTGLDPQSAFQLKQIMTEYARAGKTVFFSSHILEVVEKLCTKIAVINKGKLLAVYDIAEWTKNNDKTLEQMFFELINKDTESL